MKITKHSVVQLSYTLREDDINGKIIEEVGEQDPLTFLFGVGSMLPKFETNLEGITVGDDFSFPLIASEAYGEVNPEAIVQLEKSIFVIEGKLAEELLVIGGAISLRDENGHNHRAVVLEVTEDKVKVDFNHPLAGQDLHFSGKVLTVREATQSEIDHGHVHGPGGHQH